MEEKKYTVEELAKGIKIASSLCLALKNALKYAENFSKAIDLMGEVAIAENQPTIVKSGETWVAEYQGVDYLMTIPPKQELDIPRWNNDEFEKSVKRGEWKPISKIKITDDVAKLRPMVIDNNGNGSVLYGVIKTESMHQIHTVLAGLGNYPISILKLATVKDLTEGV